ncbi:hypothetical protein [Novosphingobium sp. BL-52-GroH]|uniref:hypothetical protein n=1 Tax=Novosphingobium sp. BL-52-GroH TaxID=3349877 RepID=UPI00384C152A
MPFTLYVAIFMTFAKRTGADGFLVRCAGMAKRPLKVFRTSIGFHDAYVATTSRKATLEAWGAGSDLFASGAAEPVNDASLVKAPLAQPGVVIRVARGSTAQHLAAAGRAHKLAPAPGKAPAPPVRLAKRAPKPSRARLDTAEAACNAGKRNMQRRWPRSMPGSRPCAASGMTCTCSAIADK